MRSLVIKYYVFRAIISLFLLLCIPHNLSSQIDTLTAVDRMSILLAQGSYEIVMDIAEKTYLQKCNVPFNLSEEDVEILCLGATAGWRKLQNSPMYEIDIPTIQYKSHKYAELIEQPIQKNIVNLLSKYEEYENMTDSSKIEYLIEVHNEYEKNFPVLYFSNSTINYSYALEHYRVVVRNCEALLKGNLAQKAMICQILLWDIPRIADSEKIESEVFHNLHLLFNLAKECEKLTEEEQYIIAVYVYGTMKNYQGLISKMIQNSILTHDTQYNDFLANYFFILSELRSFTKGNKEACRYYEADWKKIKDALYDKQIALQMFDNGQVKGFIEITKDFDTPTFTLMDFLFQSAINAMYLLNYLAKYDVIFYSPCETSYNQDIAFDYRIHQKFNLYDITRKGHTSKHTNSENHRRYLGNKILMLSNLNYGSGNLVIPLQENKKVAKKLKSIYKNKLRVCSGKNVKKNIFESIKEDIGVLHISTHGIIEVHDYFRDIDYNNMNKSEIDSLLFLYQSGVSDMKGVKLTLSGYNEDPQNNCISAYDVLRDADEFYGLVYLDACNTGKQVNNSLLSGSMAEAFYSKGATSVVAYLSPINEVVAADFAQLFYQKLRPEKGIKGERSIQYKSYHDVFYETKYEILQKYYSSDLLRRDAYGNPTIDIVLWE